MSEPRTPVVTGDDLVEHVHLPLVDPVSAQASTEERQRVITELDARASRLWERGHDVWIDVRDPEGTADPPRAIALPTLAPLYPYDGSVAAIVRAYDLRRQVLEAMPEDAAVADDLVRARGLLRRLSTAAEGYFSLVVSPDPEYARRVPSLEHDALSVDALGDGRGHLVIEHAADVRALLESLVLSAYVGGTLLVIDYGDQARWDSPTVTGWQLDEGRVRDLPVADVVLALYAAGRHSGDRTQFLAPTEWTTVRVGSAS